MPNSEPRRASGVGFLCIALLWLLVIVHNTHTTREDTLIHYSSATFIAIYGVLAVRRATHAE